MTSEVRRAETPAGIKIVEEPDPYREWQASEGVQVIVDYAFPNLNGVELGPWERKGGKGAIINIPYKDLPNDSHLIEIKPGGKSEPEHHLYEEVVYVLSGRGATSVWLDEGRKSTFEWQAGSLFALPLNAWYQHFNGSGQEPARYIAVTNAPPVMNAWRNRDFIFDNPFRFTDRFSGGEGDYFSGSGEVYQRKRRNFMTLWRSNFMPDIDTMRLWDQVDRGVGNVSTLFDMAGNVTKTHVSEFPVGTYKKAHRHGPGAHLVILGGVGFSLLWWEGQERIKVDWKRGGMVIVPGYATFHQHFNMGAEPARYLAVRGGTPGPWGDSDVSIKEGGMQVEYEDEDREVHRIFEEALREHGAPCRMKAFIPWCTGEVGPTNEGDT